MKSIKELLLMIFADELSVKSWYRLDKYIYRDVINVLRGKYAEGSTRLIYNYELGRVKIRTK